MQTLPVQKHIKASEVTSATHLTEFKSLQYPQRSKFGTKKSNKANRTDQAAT